MSRILEGLSMVYRVVGSTIEN